MDGHAGFGMSMPTFTSRAFNREPGRIKRAAADGPVNITERGRPIMAVPPYDAYERLKAAPGTILDALDMEGVGDIDIDFTRPATFSRPATDVPSGHRRPVRTPQAAQRQDQFCG